MECVSPATQESGLLSVPAVSIDLELLDPSHGLEARSRADGDAHGTCAPSILSRHRSVDAAF